MLTYQEYRFIQTLYYDVSEINTLLICSTEALCTLLSKFCIFLWYTSFINLNIKLKESELNNLIKLRTTK